jgi:hypothetical protein
MDRLFGLLSKKQRTQLDFLQLMAENFRDYALSDKAVKFSTAANSDRYSLLSKRIEDAENDLVVFTQQQLDATKAGKKKLLKMGK